MKTLHANKDYILHDGHVFILGELAEAPKHINHYVMTFEGYMKYDWSMHFGGFDRNSRIIIASTDKSLPVKHIDRSLFVKPVDVEGMAKEKFSDNFNKHTAFAMRQVWQDGYNANHNQFTLEDMNKLWRLKGNETVNFDHAIELIRPLSLPETIQCDDNYENLKPIWK